MKEIKFNIPAKNKKITAINFILSELEHTPNYHYHTANLVEKFAKIRLDFKKTSLKYDGYILPTLRGYATAIERAITQLAKEKKITIVDYWWIRKI